MGMLVIGATFVDIKGFPFETYVPDGRNAGRIEYIHGGVSRNVVEDLGNLELRPYFMSIVDGTSMGKDVTEHLNRHKVNTDYVICREGGMGKWLAVFDHNGDLAGSISERADMSPLIDILEEKGDEIFEKIDSVVVQVDLPKIIMKKVFALAEKYNKKVYAVVANMSIATEHRVLLKNFDCFICNQLEAGQFFIEDYSDKTPEEMCEIIAQRVVSAKIPSMVVTMGGNGSIYATMDGEKGICPPLKVNVVDTTGAGDSFCAGVAAGLTYGKSLGDAVAMGTRLAASVISSSENVCQRFLPEEFGLILPENFEQ